MNIESIKKMVRLIAATRSDEIGCDDCFTHLDEFVEQVLGGKTPDQFMPLVQHHLALCGDCREEYEVLLEALQTVG